jgi:hypothetical protein
MDVDVVVAGGGPGTQETPGGHQAFAAVLIGRLSYAAFLRKVASGVFAAGWQSLVRAGRWRHKDRVAGTQPSALRSEV